MSKRVAAAVVALLALGAVGLFLPFVAMLWTKSDRARCQNNLRQVAGMLLLVDPASFPAGTVVVPGLPPEKRLSWYTTLLTPLARKDLLDALDRAGGWDAPANATARGTTFAYFLCPAASRTDARPEGLTDYAGNGGVGPDGPTLAA